MRVEERVDAIEERYDKRVARIRERARREIAKLRMDEEAKVKAVREGATSLSEKGAEFIASWEGFRSTPYKPLPSETYWTWGYGHYGPEVPSPSTGRTISRGDALKLLRKDCEIATEAVNRLIAVRLSQRQFDALVSFTFNCGVGALEGSTLRAVLNAGRYAAVPGELMRWVNANGQPVEGLVRRRRAEADMFAN